MANSLNCIHVFDVVTEFYGLGKVARVSVAQVKEPYCTLEQYVNTGFSIVCERTSVK